MGMVHFRPRPTTTKGALEKRSISLFAILEAIVCNKKKTNKNHLWSWQIFITLCLSVRNAKQRTNFSKQFEIEKKKRKQGQWLHLVTGRRTIFALHDQDWKYKLKKKKKKEKIINIVVTLEYFSLKCVLIVIYVR